MDLQEFPFYRPHFALIEVIFFREVTGTTAQQTTCAHANAHRKQLIRVHSDYDRKNEKVKFKKNHKSHSNDTFTQQEEEEFTALKF